jgi:general secretion pathway protein F
MSSQKLSSEDVILLSQELQAILAAGVPLEIGLRDLAESANGPLEAAAREIADRLKRGEPLAVAIQAEARLPSSYRMVLVAGIRCGRSQAVLEDVIRLARGLSALQLELHRGLIYPACVVILAVVLSGFIATSYLPRLIELYRSLYVTVPDSLLVLERVEPASLWIAVVVGVAMLAGAQLLVTRRWGLGLSVRWLPGGARVLADLEISRVSRLLSLLLSYEVPLPEALRLVSSTLPTSHRQQQLNALAESVDRGLALDHQSASIGSIPGFLRWLIVTGARESQLPLTLNQAAEFYEERAWARGEILRRIVPSLLLLLVGGSATLLYALSVFGPMIQLWYRLGEPLR